MKKIIMMSFFLVFIVSCGQSEAPSGNDMTFDVIGVQLYNEFIPCVGGSDFNQENVDKMMTFKLFKYEKYCETCTEWVQPKGHFPMRKYAKMLTESERLQEELEPIYD